MSTLDDQRVRDFLQPLAAIEPVGRRAGEPARDGSSRYRTYLRYGAIVLGGIALIALISLIAGHRSSAPPPAKHPPKLGIFAKTSGWITFQGDNGTIQALDPTHPGRIRTIAHVAGTPVAWSRDGTQLLIVARADRVLRADGSLITVARSPKANVYLSGGSFTPDGSHVIYGLAGSVWRVPATGGKPTAILPYSARGGYYALPYAAGNELSPDGAKIVFMEWTGGFRSGTVGIAGSDGRDERTLATYRDIVTAMGIRRWRSSRINEIFPVAWFGHSSGLLIQADAKGGPCALLSVNADGSNLRRWGPPGLCPTRGALSGDGTKLAFNAFYKGRVSFVITDQSGRVISAARLRGGLRAPFFSWQP